MASLISSTSWGGGMAGGPLRCSVCGRRDAAVEHLVRARQKVVRIRPASAHVGDRETAEAAVEEAFETVFNGRVPIEERCHAIENGTPEPPTNPGRFTIVLGNDLGQAPTAHPGRRHARPIAAHGFR
jgi:hypothetical protein